MMSFPTLNSEEFSNITPTTHYPTLPTPRWYWDVLNVLSSKNVVSCAPPVMTVPNWCGLPYIMLITKNLML